MTFCENSEREQKCKGPFSYENVTGKSVCKVDVGFDLKFLNPPSQQKFMPRIPKSGGRWEAAYSLFKGGTTPENFLTELSKSKKAEAFSGR